MTHQVTIFLDGIHRNFSVNEDQLINKDWNEVLEDMFDTINKVKEI